MGLFFKKKKKFGELLVEKGLATRQDVDEAVRLQKELAQKKQIQKKIGMILNEKGIIDIEDIEKTLEDQKAGEGFFIKGLVYSLFHSR